MHPTEIDAPALELRSPPRTRGELLRVPWAQASRRDDGLLDLQLSGALHADWSLHLARGLAQRGASLQAGFARRVEPQCWLAGLAIDDRGSGPLGPRELLSLAGRSRARAARPEPRILDFELGDSARVPGWLALEVHAWDALGLLASVLTRVAEAGLAPLELILETEEECAFHRLGLVARDGRSATRRQRRALRLGMRGLLGR